MRTMEAIKINKIAMIYKCNNKSQLSQCSTCSKIFFKFYNKKKTDRKGIEQANVRGLFAFVNCIINKRKPDRIQKISEASFF